MLSLLSNSIALNRVVNDQFIANYLAMEGIEVVKNIVDGNIIQGNHGMKILITAILKLIIQVRNWKIINNAIFRLTQ